MAIDISKFKSSKVLVIGDLMIDEFIWGAVETVSREAPVPVVTVQENNFSLGGAGNVAQNLAAMGAQVSVVGITGTGLNATTMMDMFNDLGINASGVYSDKKRDTSKKIRVIASCQQVLQIDRETIKPISTAAESAMIHSIRKILPTVDIVIASDRGKGALTRPMLTEIISLAKNNNIISIVDPYGSNYERYTGATILTPNAKEVSTETGIKISDRASIFKAGTELLKKTRVEGLLVTCGKDGIVLFGRSAQPFAIESEARQVFDVTGARDTMVAVLALSLAAGGSFKDAATVANVAAGIVVGKLGTATISEKEIILELMAFSGNAAPPKDDAIFADKKTLY
ncbi:MAG: bifunctional hydroxymethylpyrimidine kinase/phosphomethylpyrimidine kinase [Proteobacteria bacterium]|nr:bifunctional hydroxymethylpyrimidine kinase/phosphomethylpyrimidine kinase [Pseudomonadota bacterium]